MIPGDGFHVRFTGRMLLTRTDVHEAAAQMGVVPRTDEERLRVFAQAVQNVTGHTGVMVERVEVEL